jgi:hypothetical protein
MPDNPAVMAASAALLHLRTGSAAVRQPSFNAPPFYSRPLVETSTRRVPALAGWTTLLSVSGTLGYPAAVTSFIATTSTDLSGNGVRFRLLRNQALLAGVDFVDGVDLCRETVSEWPARRRSLFLVLQAVDTLELQVRNLGVQQPFAITGLFGYYYPDADDSGFTPREIQRRG